MTLLTSQLRTQERQVSLSLNLSATPADTFHKTGARHRQSQQVTIKICARVPECQSANHTQILSAFLHSEHLWVSSFSSAADQNVNTDQNCEFQIQGPKSRKIWLKKNWVTQNFGRKTLVKNQFGFKKIWVRNIFSRKKNLVGKKWVKKMWVKKIWWKKMRIKKNVG